MKGIGLSIHRRHLRRAGSDPDGIRALIPFAPRGKTRRGGRVANQLDKGFKGGDQLFCQLVRVRRCGPQNPAPAFEGLQGEAIFRACLGVS